MNLFRNNKKSHFFEKAEKCDFKTFYWKETEIQTHSSTAAEFLFIEEFKTKSNNEEISDAIDELKESFTKYESVIRREAFIVGVWFGIRMG